MGQLLVIALRIATNFIEKKLVAPHSLAQFGLRRSYLLNGSCAAYALREFPASTDWNRHVAALFVALDEKCNRLPLLLAQFDQLLD
jgi:hypothetical protein